MKCRLTAVLLSVIAFTAGCAKAEVRPNGLFSENCVLQRGVQVPVWGTAENGEKVTVQFQNQTVSTTPADGKWRVMLKPLTTGGPFTMTIRGANTVEIKNVLVGEVWLCGGQSNMQWAVHQSADPEKHMASAQDSHLRLVTIPRRASDEPLTTVEAAWKEASGENIRDFSAVAYHFGKRLREQLKVPVVLISSNYGGTPAEAWMRRESIEQVPELRPILTEHQKRVDDYPALMKAHEAAVEKARAEGKQIPRPPADPKTSPQRPTGLYNAMIAPLSPYAIRGAIWYQGESNAGRAHQYRTLFPEMIYNWRRAMGNRDFPFLFVQLAPFMEIKAEPMDSAWAELREAQRMTARAVPYAGMVVITDVGEERDIHPKKKEPVGERLALAARALAYGESVKWEGPEFDAVKFEAGKAIVQFRLDGSALQTPNGEDVKGFTIAGEDRKFVNASARIEGNKVIVWSEAVPNPVAVRYGWANYPVVNLRNKEGLWASPFRTDTWPGITQARP